MENNYEVCFIDDIFVLTKSKKLTTSLVENEKIATSFWRSFQQDIKTYHLTQGMEFVKYGITHREDEQLHYICGIPSKENYPITFRLYHIPRGHYLKYIHRGDMKHLSESIRILFEDILPSSKLTRKIGTIQYYEKYTSDFHFNREDSIIELYVPILIKEKTEFQYIKAKSLLQGGTSIQNGYQKFSWFGMDFNMNLYKGCNHGCIYCDSRSACYQVENFDIVRGKENELELLEKELSRKRRKGTIGIGAMSDTYNSFEKEKEITRGALQLIDKYGFGIGIDTKSTLILRDIDLIAHIARQYPSIIKVTITCADDELGKIIEPNAPLSSERFKIFDAMHEHGIYAGILFMPLLPFINDTEENIRQIVYLAHIHHAKFIYPGLGVTLRAYQRDYFYHRLNHYFPGKMELYEQRYHKTYSCDVPDARRLWNIFKKECEKYGIVYKMKDIINGYKSVVPNEQMQLPLL